jgi:Flp pilus assembly protein TadG
MNLLLKPLLPSKSNLAGRARNSRSTSGQAFFLLTVCLAILFAFMALSIDYGMMVLRANQLQKACDAAALAAAVDIYRNPSLNISPANSSATAKAQLVGALNNATISSVTFSGTSSSGTVTVEGKATQVFYFAPVMGFKSSALDRLAKANYSAVTGIVAVVPLGMTVADYNTYLASGAAFTLTLVRNDKSAFGSGDAIALSMGSGKSPSQWESNLASGVSGVTNIGDTIDLNSLNASLQTEQPRLQSGLSGRIGTSFGIIITDPAAQTPGTSSHPIKGIAIVTLVNVDDDGNLTFKISPPAISENGITGGTQGLTNAYKIYLAP